MTLVAVSAMSAAAAEPTLVDKAKAVIVKDAGGKVLYFASEETLKLALFVPLKNSYVDSVIKATTAETEALGGTVEVFDANFDAATLTLNNGKVNVMPAQEAKLTPAQIQVLAAYVWGLSNKAPAKP